MTTSHMPGGRGGAEPSATQAFGYAWGLAKQDFAGVVLPPAVAFLLSMVINIGLNLLMVPVKVALGVKVGVAAGVKAGVATGLVMGAIIDALIAVPAIAAGAFFTGGIYLFASRLVRGQKPGFGEVFGGMQVFGPALVAMLGTVGLPAILRPLLGLVPFVGTGLGTLLIFAGGFSYWWAVAVAVEQRLSDTRAVTEGWAEAFRAPVTSLLLMLFGGLGVLACCIGMFVTIPLLWIAVAHVYHARRQVAA
jgi:uncharacterized membrane protein